MKTITLSDITQADFDAAVQTVIAGIKAYNRKLDTRAGTVLRDLLVDPSAAIDGVVAGQIEEVRKSSSLMRLKEAQEAGESVDQEDINAILTNFNIKSASGTSAKGIIKVVVSDGSIAYSIPEGSIFRTVGGLEFAVDQQTVAARFDMSDVGVVSTTRLYEGAAGYFFLVPVTATAIGVAGNIAHGTALTPNSQISAFVMAEAYKDFDGGSDSQSLSATIDSIPSGLSIRGFVNKNAVEGMLRSEFDAGDFPMVAVSTVGYGHGAQRRDKHNIMGVGIGGRIDVYVRNFTDAYTVTKTVRGVRTGDGKYTLQTSPEDFPGACWVKSVSDPFTEQSDEDVLATLTFEAERTADVSRTWHDIDVSFNASEAFNTVWQGFNIFLTDVPANENTGDSDSANDAWSEERNFKVTMYCLPQAQELQSYVDRDDIRNVATDVVVRCPIVCNVSVNAVIHYDPKKPVESVTARAAIRNYINQLGFVGRLTRSDIVQILKNLGAVSVDMPNQDMLYGTMHDALGVNHVLSGDALDVIAISNDEAMISKDTVIFVAEERNIQIQFVPNV
jgi:hypothetical protein